MNKNKKFNLLTIFVLLYSSYLFAYDKNILKTYERTAKIKNNYKEIDINSGLKIINDPIIKNTLKKKRDDWLKEKIDPLIINMEKVKRTNMRKYNFGKKNYDRLLKRWGIKEGSNGINNVFVKKIKEKLLGINSVELDKMLKEMLDKNLPNSKFDLQKETTNFATLEKFKRNLHSFFYDSNKGLISKVNKVDFLNKALAGAFGEDWEDNFNNVINDISKFESILSGKYIIDYMDTKDKELIKRSELYKSLKNGDYLRKHIEDYITKDPKMFGLEEGKNYNIFSLDFLEKASLNTTPQMPKNNICEIFKCQNDDSLKNQEDCKAKGLDKKSVKDKLNQLKQQVLLMMIYGVMEQLLVDLTVNELIDSAKEAIQCSVVASMLNSSDKNEMSFNTAQLQKCLADSKATDKDTEMNINMNFQTFLDNTFSNMGIFDITIAKKPAIEVGVTGEFNLGEFTSSTISECIAKNKPQSWVNSFNWCRDNVHNMNMDFGFTKYELKNNLFKTLKDYKRETCKTKLTEKQQIKQHNIILDFLLPADVNGNELKKTMLEIEEKDKELNNLPVERTLVNNTSISFYKCIENKSGKVNEKGYIDTLEEYSEDCSYEINGVTKKLSKDFMNNTDSSFYDLIKLENTVKYINEDYKEESEILPYYPILSFYELKEKYVKECESTINKYSKYLDNIKKNEQVYTKNEKDEVILNFSSETDLFAYQSLNKSYQHCKKVFNDFSNMTSYIKKTPLKINEIAWESIVDLPIALNSENSEVLKTIKKLKDDKNMTTKKLKKMVFDILNEGEIEIETEVKDSIIIRRKKISSEEKLFLTIYLNNINNLLLYSSYNKINNKTISMNEDIDMTKNLEEELKNLRIKNKKLKSQNVNVYNIIIKGKK